jgi:hypothetical protein
MQLAPEQCHNWLNKQHEDEASSPRTDNLEFSRIGTQFNDLSPSYRHFQQTPQRDKPFQFFGTGDPFRRLHHFKQAI